MENNFQFSYISKMHETPGNLTTTGKPASILLGEQNFPFILDVADDAYVMSRGKVADEFKLQDLMGNEEFKIKYLGIVK